MIFSMYFQCIFRRIKTCTINVFLNLKSSKHKNTSIHLKQMTFFQNTLKIHECFIRFLLKYIEIH